jgi:hypothetical protein
VVAGGGHGQAAWVSDSAQFSPEIRSWVGLRRVPLGDFLSASLAAGLYVARVVELGEGITPWMFGVTAVAHS